MCLYWHLWAKTGSGNRWHALPYHLLDVAATAEALWARLPLESRRPALQLPMDSALVERAVVFLAAAHDIGKANRHFQTKDPVQRSRLKQIPLDLPPREAIDKRGHGQATGAFVESWLERRWGWCPFPARLVAGAVGGHHGTFYQDVSPHSLEIHRPPWCDAGTALLDAPLRLHRRHLPPAQRNGAGPSGGKPLSLRLVLECPKGDTSGEARRDVPVAWPDRLTREYTVRFVREETIQKVPEVLP